MKKRKPAAMQLWKGSACSVMTVLGSCVLIAFLLQKGSIQVRAAGTLTCGAALLGGLAGGIAASGAGEKRTAALLLSGLVPSLALLVSGITMQRESGGVVSLLSPGLLLLPPLLLMMRRGKARGRRNVRFRVRR